MAHFTHSFDLYAAGHGTNKVRFHVERIQAGLSYITGDDGKDVFGTFTQSGKRGSRDAWTGHVVINGEILTVTSDTLENTVISLEANWNTSGVRANQTREVA